MKFIAGIDPGTTTGIAIADISSDHYETFSARFLSAGDICDFLISKGKPVAVASDVRPVPGSVRKIASAFNARAVAPPRDLTLQDKRHLIGSRAAGNAHERDALGAALFAKQLFSPVLRKVDAALGRIGRFPARDEVKELLIKRAAGNIEQALAMLEPPAPKPPARLRAPEPAKPKPQRAVRIQPLLARISELEAANAALQKELAVWTRRKESRVLANLRTEMARQRARCADLERRSGLLERLSATHDIVVRSESGERCANRVVLLSAQRDLPRVEAQRPRAIIADAFIDTDIPVVSSSAIPLETIGPFLAVERQALDTALARSFACWVRQYKDARKHAHEQ